MNNYPQSVDNSQMSIGFQVLQSFLIVNNLLIAKNLMCMVKYANLEELFYQQYPQAIITYTSIFRKIKKEE